MIALKWLEEYCGQTTDELISLEGEYRNRVSKGYLSAVRSSNGTGMVFLKTTIYRGIPGVFSLIIINEERR
jgi:hypothetical protein